MRRVLASKYVAAAALTIVAGFSSLFVAVSPAAARHPHYPGPAGPPDLPAGTVSCRFKVNVPLSPAASLTSAGPSSADFRKAKLTDCSNSIPGVRIIRGKLNSSSFFSGGPLFTCVSSGGGVTIGTPGTTHVTLNIIWYGTFRGTAGGVSYVGKAQFTGTALSFTGETIVDSPTMDQITLQGGTAPQALGDSFTNPFGPNTITATLDFAMGPGALASLCSGHGISDAVFEGGSIGIS